MIFIPKKILEIKLIVIFLIFWSNIVVYIELKVIHNIWPIGWWHGGPKSNKFNFSLIFVYFMKKGRSINSPKCLLFYGQVILPHVTVCSITLPKMCWFASPCFYYNSVWITSENKEKTSSSFHIRLSRIWIPITKFFKHRNYLSNLVSSYSLITNPYIHIYHIYTVTYNSKLHQKAEKDNSSILSLSLSLTPLLF